jgi:hypothetical protein
MEVEFNQPPDILYTFQTTELTNPSVIKNSFSKQITIYGSPQNNNIFGQYWNVERLQGTGSGIGTYFNPSKKVPFTLYINGDIYESGYVKLDEVKIVEGKSVEYYITLYGGLGSFFYNLSTDWNTGNKRTLADLNYYKWTDSTTPLDLSFTINKETVASAWTSVNSNDVYSVINFAPVYNGIPDNIDADKAVINFNGLSGFSSSVTIDNKTYTTANGYALATLPQKLMAEEVRDYRSYLQTPIIRVKNIIEAICRPENNSGIYDNGFEVDLDRDFFATDNPYYYDSWLTLPSLTNLEFSYEGGVPTAYTGTFTSATTQNGIIYTFPLESAITENNTSVKMSFDLTVLVTSWVVDNLYMWWTRRKGRNAKVHYRNAYGLQLYASNSLSTNENVLAGSSIKWLTGEQKYDYNDAVSSGQYRSKYNADVDTIIGNFVNIPNSQQYKFSTRIELTCDLPVGATCFKLQFIQTNSSNNSDRNKLSTSTAANTGELRDIFAVMPFKTVPSDDKVITVQRVDDSSSYSNRYISKQMLLGTDFSPCDFLLSYCKQFGLYIYKDKVEDKIYIKTRKNFYNRDNVIDLSDKIDKLSDFNVKPLNIDYGFFSLTNSGETSKFYTDYSQKYGKTYGMKSVSTGYDFNADTKNLIDSCLKGAVQAKEMSQYFYKPNSKVHPYIYNGAKYTLYEGGNVESGTTDVNAPIKVIATDFEPYNESVPGYDLVSKAQFYDASRKSLPTEYVMLFFNGYESIPASYNWNLTDDIGAMYSLNNNPCWLLTTSSTDKGGNEIALPITQFPRFSRWFEGNKLMRYSWDFGSPRELYVPDMSNNEEGNIYWNYFKTYYEDAYDVNSKIVEAYVINKDFTHEDLRNFYWFDNAIWALIKIEDYNVTSFDGTKCTFLKVQNKDSYTNEDATSKLWVKVTLDRYSLPASGGTIIGTVKTADNYGWTIEGIDVYPPDSSYTITVDPQAGGSSGNFFITGGTNDGYDKIITIYVTAGDTGANAKFIHDGLITTFEVTPSQLRFPASGGTDQITITNPMEYEWQIVGRPGWTSCSPISGSSTSSTISVTTTANTGDELTGSIVIWNKTKNETIIIPVVQETSSPYLRMIPSAIRFYGDGGEAEIAVEANISWNVKFSGETNTTAITISNLTWVSDIPAIGGVANSGNCSFDVIAYYDDGTTGNVTSQATVSGEKVICSTTSDTRHAAGVLSLTATYSGLSDTKTTAVYQAGNGLTAITFSNVYWVNDLPWSGGSATKNDCVYVLTGHYGNGTTRNINSEATVTGSKTVTAKNYAHTRATADTLTLTATLDGVSGTYNAEIYELPVEISQIPLTFVFTSNGTVNWLYNWVVAGVGTLSIDYRINGGSWTTITSSTDGVSFNANSGDRVEFRGSNARYSNLPTGYNTFSGTTGQFSVEGNLMSMIYGDNFETASTISEQYAFNRFFAGISGMTTAEYLYMPATTVPMHVYSSMFEGSGLVKSPELPATTLTNSCYNEMFKNCRNLNHIRCYATDVSAYNCTYNWVSGVSATGTFVKDSIMTSWTTGNSGIPTGWVVEDIGPAAGSVEFVFSEIDDYGEFNIEITSIGVDNVITVDRTTSSGVLATGFTTGTSFSVGVQNLNSLGKGTRQISISYATSPNINFVEVPAGQFTWLSGVEYDENKKVYIQVI